MEKIREKLINTDENGYILEKLKDGFPASSPRTRYIESPTRFGKDAIIQYPSSFKDYNSLINLKKSLLIKNKSKYHQENFKSLEIKNRWMQKISSFTNPEFHSGEVSMEELLINIPLDVIICEKSSDKNSNFISLCHLVFPNGWAAEEAINKNFQYFHKDVKNGNKQVITDSEKFVDHMIYSGKVYERVGAYSIRTHSNYDRHPNSGIKDDFENAKNIYLRFERQTIVSVPELDGFLFFVQSHMVDMKTNPELFINAVTKRDKNCYPRETINKYENIILKYLEDKIKVNN